MSELPNRFEQHARLTLVIFLVAVVVMADFTVGHFVLKRKSNLDLRIQSPYYHHDLRANFAGTDSWGSLTHKMYTNSLGFKDSEVRTVSLTSNTHRILFLGDSFTEGIGVVYEDTFVGRIAQALAPQGIEVLNAGVASYSPRLFYLKVKHLLELGFRFDELVVFSDISDPQDEVDYAAWTPTTENSLENMWRKTSVAVDHFLEHRSLIYLHVIRPTLFGVTWERVKNKIGITKIKNTEVEEKHTRNRGRWTFDPDVYAEWGEKGVASEIMYMDRLHELVHSKGIKMSIAVYPWPITIEHDVAHSKRVTIWEGFVRGSDIGFYDFFPFFMATTTPKTQVIKDNFIEGDVHWNAEGHKIIADAWLKMYSKGHK